MAQSGVPMSGLRAGPVRHRWLGRGLGALRGLIADRRGATALEFGLVAPTFLVAAGAILEFSVMLFTSSVMEGAALDAGRQVRTGLAQKSADPLTAFKNQLCASLYFGVDCDELVFDVRTYADFTSTSVAVTVDEDGKMVDPIFSPGNAGDIVVVRATYRWNFLTPLVGHLVSDVGTNSTLLISTAVFRNEPFGDD